MIETKDWTDAFKWNARNHKVKKLDNIYFTSDKIANLSKENCQHYLQSLKQMPWLNFDEMNSVVNSIFQITINAGSWENSKCSCRSWLKNYK